MGVRRGLEVGVRACMRILFDSYHLALLFISKAQILIQSLLNIYMSVSELLTIHCFSQESSLIQCTGCNLLLGKAVCLLGSTVKRMQIEQNVKCKKCKIM